MRERKFVKLNVSIYDDTKTKLIDQRPERDFIHYFFARSITLAGKANRDGDLYMSKNIPYTIETLAIEFNREVSLVKVALDVLIELEMIELTEDKIYRVKNFVKHQNIKVKEKVQFSDKEENSVNINSAGAAPETHIENVVLDNNTNEFKNEITISDKSVEKPINNIEDIRVNEGNIVEISCADTKTTDNNINDEKTDDKSQRKDIPMIMERKNNKKSNKKKKKELGTEIIEEEIEDDTSWFRVWEGEERPLGKDEQIIRVFTFD